MKTRSPAALLALCAVLLGSRALGQSAGPISTTAPERQELDVHALDGGFTVLQSADAGTLIPPVLTRASPAEYPSALAGTDVSGEVELELLVDEHGAVAEVQVSRSARPELDAAALAAASKLQFQPATLDGVPLATRMHFTYAFRPAPRAAPQATLKGLVRSKGTRRPIIGATLLFQVAGAQPLPPVETNAEARFEVALPPGPVQVQVTAPGYKPATLSETLAERQTLEVVYALEPVRVSPYETFVRGEKERTEVARVTLHAQELTEVPGTMGDPFRVIMLMPGVSSVMSGLSYPVVRGSQPASTGYFLDGVHVPELFHLLLGPAVIYPEFIEGIDFYPGPAPAQFGRLIGGAVEGNLRKPREDRLHVSAYADLINAGAMVEDNLPATGTSVTLAGRYSYSPWILAAAARNFIPPDGEGYKTVPIANFWDYQGRLEQKLGPGKLRLFVFGASDEVGARSGNPRQINPRVLSIFHRADLRYRLPAGPGELEVGLTYGTQQLSTRLEQADALKAAYELIEQETVGRASWSGDLGPTLKLSVGGDVTARRSHNLIQGSDPGTTGGSDALLTYRQPLVLTAFAGLWSELVWKPTEALTVVPGLRADNYHLTPGLDFQAVDPRITARYQLTPTLVLKAGAGLVHQAPAVLINLPVMDADSLHYGLQSGAQTDLGAEWAPLPGFEVAVDAYYNPLFRAVEINLLEVLESRRRFSIPGYDPGVPGRSYGAEILIRHPIGDHWFGWISYAYQRSQRFTSFSRLDEHNQIAGTVRGWVPFAFEQQHVANAALSYQFDSGWTVGTVLHFNTGRPQSGDISSRSYHEGTGLDGQVLWIYDDRDRVQRLPSYFRVDARVSKTWVFDQFTLEASLDVQNLSLSQEVLSYYYDYQPVTAGPDQPPAPDAPLTFIKQAIQIPVVVPMLGVKVNY